MKTLNERYDYGLDLFLLSIDEGITGYRDDSLEVLHPFTASMSLTDESPRSVIICTCGKPYTSSKHGNWT
jgi:hypothetical protein